MLEKMRPLTQDDELKLDQIDIPKGKAYVIELDRVIEERCDELDYILEDHGFEIFHRDYETLATNIYHYRVYFVELNE